MKKRVLITATVMSHIAQFHKGLIELLHKKGYEVHVAAYNNLGEKDGLSIKEADMVFEIPFSRSPIKKDNFIAYCQLKKIIDENKYEIIHCNTPMGGIITRLAAKTARKNGTKVIYMAHGFHFYKGGPKINWLLYYPIEKIMCRYTDMLITITYEDYNLAKQKFKTDVRHIHGVGVNSKKYYPVSKEKSNEVKK